MTPAQLRAARALIYMSQQELAKTCQRSTSLIRNFENERRPPHQNIIDVMQRAMEDAGVEFIEGGVRLKKQA